MKRKTPRGRQRKRWKDSVRELLGEIGADWEQVYDRQQRKEIVLAAKSLNGSESLEQKKLYFLKQ